MAQTKRRPKKRQDENFFEALGTTASRYQYHDNTDDESNDDPKTLNDAKLTAIITLILVILVAITMGILILRGIQTIKGNIPANSSSSGSIQL